MSSTLTFSLNYQRRITHITHGADLTDIVAYAGELQPFTRAAITRATCTLQAPLTNTPMVGEYSTTDIYAKIFLNDPVEEIRYAIILPAPVSDMFEEVTGKGWRVKEAIGQQLAGYYSAFAGITLEFVDGWLCGQR